LILTVLPATFSSAIVYFAWQEWHVIFMARMNLPLILDGPQRGSVVSFVDVGLYAA
jgi:hypothetical protein